MVPGGPHPRRIEAHRTASEYGSRGASADRRARGGGIQKLLLQGSGYGVRRSGGVHAPGHAMATRRQRPAALALVRSSNGHVQWLTARRRYRQLGHQRYRDGPLGYGRRGDPDVHRGCGSPRCGNGGAGHLPG